MESTRTNRQGRAGMRISAIAIGSVLMVTIAIPWFVYVLRERPDIAEGWYREVTRDGASNLQPDNWYTYISAPAFMLPWTAFFLVGLVMSIRDTLRGNRRAAAILLLAVLPVVIMSFFKDKPARYLQPMLAPAAIMTAIAITGQFRAWRDRAPVDKAIATLHGVGIFVFTLGVPIAGLYVLKTREGEPWYSLQYAMKVAAVGLLAATVIVVLSRRNGAYLVAGTAALVLALQPVIVQGYARSAGGRSEMKPIADHLWAIGERNPVILQGARRRHAPMDTFIYSNRVFPTVESLEPPTWPQSPRTALLLRTGDDLSIDVPVPWKVAKAWEITPRRRWYLLTADVGGNAVSAASSQPTTATTAGTNHP